MNTARLLAEAGFEVVGRAGDVDELLHEVAEKEPDVAIVATVVSQLVGRRRHGHDPIDDLPDRQRQVLALMAQGRSNRAIAERLFITERTVEEHLKIILGKLRITDSPDDHRRVLAVLAYLGA